MSSREIAWAAAGAVVAAGNTIYMHMQRPSLVGANRRGRACALVRSRQGVRPGGRRAEASSRLYLPPAETHRSCAPLPALFYWSTCAAWMGAGSVEPGFQKMCFSRHIRAKQSSPLIPPLCEFF